MKVNIQRWPFLYSFFILIALSVTNIAFADPPNRVARISFVDNVVSFLPAGANQWVKARLNRPLILGDSLWTDLDSKAELQLGLSVLRQGPKTYMKILNLNNKVAQFKLTQGTLVLSIRQVRPQQFYEIDTPNLALVIRQPGYYRIDVNKQLTTVTVRKGGAIVYGQKRAYKLNLGRSCKFWGVNLQRFQCVTIGPTDSFDRWSLARDERLIKITTTYVSQSMIGYEDLNYHGKWIVTKKYGRAWVPNEVSSNWAPYRVGQWTWVRYWGWTWVDDQPWGFAPFHYGRWAFVERRWVWVPGPANIEPIYAPALVAFVGGRNYLSLPAGRRGIAWFPLAPGEVYIPPYPVSRNYFTQLNLGNTYINQNYLTNIYNNPTTVINYQNININNAVTAVPVQTFVSSQPVSQSLVNIPTKTVIDAPKTPIAAVAPKPISLLGGGADEKTAQPAAAIENQPAVALTPPPAPPAPFAEEQKLLNKDPGKPLTVEEAQQLQPAKEATQQSDNNEVKVISPEEEPKPINAQPEVTEPAKQPEESGQDVNQPDALQPTTIPPADVTNQPTAPQPETITAPGSNESTPPQPEVTQPEVAPADVQQPNNSEPQEIIQEPVTSPEEQTTQPEVIQQPEGTEPDTSQANPTTSEEPTVQPEQEVTQPPVDETTTTVPAETVVPDETQPATVVEPQEVIIQPSLEEVAPAPADVPVEPEQMPPQEALPPETTVIQPGTTTETEVPQ
ncbi:DUF6600 domain-containing protein [Legionella sp. CNM-1927-20]|uniref:DUF6600 domain-containing protein n=1 Tax=Legionella sp. CNM-1927-20 TaxID=3422221 RepID=UPI00403AD40A